MPLLPANRQHVETSARPKRIKAMPRQRRRRNSPAPVQPSGKVEKRHCRIGSHFEGNGLAPRIDTPERYLWSPSFEGAVRL
jgi:hypothetical protein